MDVPRSAPTSEARADMIKSRPVACELCHRLRRPPESHDDSQQLDVHAECPHRRRILSANDTTYPSRTAAGGHGTVVPTL